MTSTIARETDPAQRDDASRAGGSIFSGVLSGITTALVILVCILSLALAVVPRFMGGSALTVLTGSMEPTYSPGDMIAVKAATVSEIQAGDVVTFQPNSGDPTLITHRIITKQMGDSKDGTLFVTQGDANGAPDAPIVAGQIKGVVMYHVPYIGHVAMAVGEHRQLALIAAATALVGYGAFMIFRPSSGARNGRNSKEQP